TISIWQILQSMPPWQIIATFGFAIIPLAWLILTAAAFMVFQWSMQRAHVKAIHVFRCVVYAGDVIVWVNLIYTLTLAAVSYNFVQGVSIYNGMTFRAFDEDRKS